MNTLAALQAARTALLTLSKPVHFGSALDVDANGYAQLPAAAASYVIDLVVGNPAFQWGQSPYGLAVVQVSAFSRVDGEPLAMLQAAAAPLIAARFAPGPITDLGRARATINRITRGGTAWSGAAQDWERNE